jgi:serine/threonine protein phosphatase 1
MFGAKEMDAAVARGPRGQRAYVVGDIHGRLDLLERLLDEIHRDIARRPARKVILVFLGDLVDRGPSSAEVVERLRTYRHPGVRPVFLLGNHEEVLLRVIAGESQLIPGWLRFGGGQCLKSYGVDPQTLSGLGDSAKIAAIAEAIPEAHVDFLRTFADSCRFGDYVFVHAGVRPGVPLDQQLQSDLRWIREPFLADESDHGFVVVHGHTIRPEIEERTNRIGIDTGAYATGVLTALVIEEGERRLLDTRVAEDMAVPATH